MTDEMREKDRARARAWKKRQLEADPEGFYARRRDIELRSRYGIGLEDYDRMLAEQNGRCLICGKPEERAPKQGNCLSVDHDHVTGAVRGLLCVHCNAILGYAEDGPHVLRMAIHYLEETTYGAPVE